MISFALRSIILYFSRLVREYAHAPFVEITISCLYAQASDSVLYTYWLVQCLIPILACSYSYRFMFKLNLITATYCAYALPVSYKSYLFFDLIMHFLIIKQNVLVNDY